MLPSRKAILTDIRAARAIYVAIHGKQDVAYLQITKTQARTVLITLAGNCEYRYCLEDGAMWIDAAH